MFVINFFEHDLFKLLRYQKMKKNSVCTIPITYLKIQNWRFYLKSFVILMPKSSSGIILKHRSYILVVWTYMYLIIWQGFFLQFLTTSLMMTQHKYRNVLCSSHKYISILTTWLLYYIETCHQYCLNESTTTSILLSPIRKKKNCHHRKLPLL